MKRRFFLLPMLSAASLLVLGCDAQSKEPAKTSTVKLDDTSFVEKVEKGSGVAMIDFWAAWCGPCKVIAPTVEAIAEKYDGKVLVGKVDVDSVTKAPSKYSIRSIPALVFFKDGKKVGQLVGVQSQKAIEKELAKHL